jgi:hypothetical protein
MTVRPALLGTCRKTCIQSYGAADQLASITNTLKPVLDYCWQGPLHDVGADSVSKYHIYLNNTFHLLLRNDDNSLRRVRTSLDIENCLTSRVQTLVFVLGVPVKSRISTM